MLSCPGVGYATGLHEFRYKGGTYDEYVFDSILFLGRSLACLICRYALTTD